jgi:ubiquinone/menaquinone biosynthesis C-methylase UbiE
VSPPATDPIVAFFDRRPAQYERQLPLERRALRVAAGLAQPAAGRRVVDLAAGTGALAEALLSRGPAPAALTLVDASPRMLDRARARLGASATFVVADARAVPVPDASADIVTIGYLFHLLDADARLAVMREARRLLGPGGVMVAVVHGSPRGPVGRAHRAAWRLAHRLLPGAVIGGGPMKDLAPIVAAAGFDVEISRRVPGLYWSQVIRARSSDGSRAQR